MTVRLPYPPPWQDISTLCGHTCLSEATVDKWVKLGLLPPPRQRGGKRMWKWSEVNAYLENGGNDVPVSQGSDVEQVREATRRAVSTKN
jgi:predicted DNA-binding transcriptional regulator AlpA